MVPMSPPDVSMTERGGGVAPLADRRMMKQQVGIVDRWMLTL